MVPSSASCSPLRPTVTAPTVHVHQPGFPPPAPHVLDHHRVVGDRVGVGHREHRGVAAQSRRHRAGLDGLGVLPARLPQVRVQVDEAGEHDGPAEVEQLVGVGVDLRGDVGDQAVLHQQVHRVALAVRADLLQQHPAHAGTSSPASRW